jgi:hypothetical protein
MNKFKDYNIGISINNVIINYDLNDEKHVGFMKTINNLDGLINTVISYMEVHNNYNYSIHTPSSLTYLDRIISFNDYVYLPKNRVFNVILKDMYDIYLDTVKPKGFKKIMNVSKNIFNKVFRSKLYKTNISYPYFNANDILITEICEAKSNNKSEYLSDIIKNQKYFIIKNDEYTIERVYDDLVREHGYSYTNKYLNVEYIIKMIYFQVPTKTFAIDFKGNEYDNYQLGIIGIISKNDNKSICVRIDTSNIESLKDIADIFGINENELEEVSMMDRKYHTDMVDELKSYQSFIEFEKKKTIFYDKNI